MNQKVVNTATITFGEGQFEQWDSYTEIDTNWTPIILVNNYLFTLLDYDGTNWRRDRLQKYFKDLQAKILTYDGVFINKNRIKSANKIEELPLEIWASQIIIKIKASIKGEPVSKFIIFNPTYGC